jgi:hypothetical protein
MWIQRQSTAVVTKRTLNSTDRYSATHAARHEDVDKAQDVDDSDDDVADHRRMEVETDVPTTSGKFRRSTVWWMVQGRCAGRWTVHQLVETNLSSTSSLLFLLNEQEQMTTARSQIVMTLTSLNVNSLTTGPQPSLNVESTYVEFFSRSLDLNRSSKSSLYD